MMPAITTQELEDQIGCNNPTCEKGHPIAITSKCHPKGPLRIAFDRNNGSLWVHCASCGNEVTNILIAKAPVH